MPEPRRETCAAFVHLVVGEFGHVGAPGTLLARILRFSRYLSVRFRPPGSRELREYPAHQRARTRPARSSLRRAVLGGFAGAWSCRRRGARDDGGVDSGESWGTSWRTKVSCGQAGVCAVGLLHDEHCAVYDVNTSTATKTGELREARGAECEGVERCKPSGTIKEASKRSSTT